MRARAVAVAAPVSSKRKRGRGKGAELLAAPQQLHLIPRSSKQLTLTRSDPTDGRVNFALDVCFDDENTMKLKQIKPSAPVLKAVSGTKGDAVPQSGAEQLFERLIDELSKSNIQ